MKWFLSLNWPKQKLVFPTFLQRVPMAFGLLFNTKHYIILAVSKDQNDQIKNVYEGLDVELALGIVEA